jgi:trans-AT polyketide synthase/acyltransferase/oxidoreductase domain-containing protein
MAEAFLFAGQGSQTLGMGRDLFDEFAEMTATADDVLGYSIVRVCMGDPARPLDDTRYAQPALYVVCALGHLQQVARRGRTPGYVAGHSLGEYTALYAAGAYSFDVGLRLVAKRGDLMGRVKEGGMAAVSGLDAKTVTQILAENSELSALDVANLNSPSQTVVSGPRAVIERAQPVFERAGARLYLPLRVSGAFHSRYMGSVQDELKSFLKGLPVAAPKIPVVSNVVARLYSGDPRDLLVKQLTSPVRWTDSVRFLLEKGVEEFVEIGPGRVLTKLVETIRKEQPLSPQAEAIREQQPPSPRAEVPPHPAEPAIQRRSTIAANTLGSAEFKRDHRVKLAYIVGAADHGVTSADLVARCSRSGVLAFFGTRGLSLEQAEAGLKRLRTELRGGEPFGVGIRSDVTKPERDRGLIDLCLDHGVQDVEARGFLRITPELVRYRFHGRTLGDHHRTDDRRLIARVSHTDAARAFMSPAPERLLSRLVSTGEISKDAAALARTEPMAWDVCVEADCSGPTDMGAALALLPAIIQLRDAMGSQFARRIRVGLAGGIGEPAAAAAAFTMGADFVITGSINQCTREAATSEAVKEMLESADVHDTAYAPAGDLFEFGSRARVLKKGVFFPARAEKLFNLYVSHESIEEIPASLRVQIEQPYFGQSFDSLWSEIHQDLARTNQTELVKAEQSPKVRLALVFRRYFDLCTRFALDGSAEQRVNYQVPCSPAMGACNRWLQDGPYSSWRDRHAETIAEMIMTETASLLTTRLQGWAI